MPESSKQKWLWAVLALLMLTSVGIGIVAFKLMKKSSIGANVVSVDSGAITQIDLTTHYPPSLPKPEQPYGGGVKFSAVDADSGKPIANVKLKISGNETSGSFRVPDAVTDAEGQCLVRHPGLTTVSLTLVASGVAVPTTRIRWQTERGDKIPSEYVFRVNKPMNFGGTVLDEAEQPVVNAQIYFRDYAYANSPTDPRESFLIHGSTVMTGPDGRWGYKNLPPNFRDFWITISHPEFVDARLATDDPRRDFQRVSLLTFSSSNAVTRLHRGVPVTGRVVDETGHPIKGAKLLLGNSRFNSNTNLGRTDERGEFRLRTAETNAYLTVQANGYSPDMRQIMVDANTAPAEFKLAPGHTFKAKVVDEFGTPVSGALITVERWRNRQTLILRGTTDSRGKVTIHSLPEGGMFGSISKSGYVRTNGVPFAVDGEEITLTLRKNSIAPK